MRNLLPPVGLRCPTFPFSPQVKVESAYFEMEKFLPHQKVFYPSFVISWKSGKLKNLNIEFVASSAQKGDKKLSEGVKNFFMINSNVSTFSWTKNHPFIWKTHSYTFDQTEAVKSNLGSAIWGISFKRKQSFFPLWACCLSSFVLKVCPIKALFNNAFLLF